MVVLVTMFSVVVGLLTLLVAGLLRSHAQIMRALHELGADVGARPSARSSPEPASGRQPSDVVGTSTEGDAASIGVLGARNATLLAFLSSGCHTCADFWGSFAHPDGLDVPGDARLVIVTKDAGEESISKIRKLEPADVPVVMSSSAWRAYDVPVVPYFVYVDGRTRQIIGEGAAGTWANVESMIGQALADADLVDGDGRPRRRARVRRQSDQDRSSRIDAELRAAGVTPGDPSLYPRTADDFQAPADGSDGHR